MFDRDRMRLFGSDDLGGLNVKLEHDHYQDYGNVIREEMVSDTHL